MTPEQKRIQALEDTVLELVATLEETRMGYGARFATRIRHRIGQNRRAYKFATQAKRGTPPPAEATPPAAPVEGEAA